MEKYFTLKYKITTSGDDRFTGVFTQWKNT